MPTKRVLDLPAVTSMANNDLFYIVRDSEPTPTQYDKKITWANVLAGLDTRYLPKTFASPQVLTYTGQSAFIFSDSEFVVIDTNSAPNQSNASLRSGYGLAVYNSAGFTGSLDASAITADRTWTMPNASGTLALTSQIPSLAGYATEAWVTAGFQPLDADLTALAALSGTSGLIRRTGSSFVYDNAAYITASALAGYATESWVNAGFVSLSGSYANPSWITSLAWSKITGAPMIPVGSDYITKDGTTTTTASIPFALGASFGGVTTFNDVATFNFVTQQKLGFQINPPSGSSDYITSAGTGYLEIWAVAKDLFLHSDDDLIYDATNYHKWNGGISGSTEKYQFGGGGIALPNDQTLSWAVGSIIRGTGAGNIQITPNAASNGALFIDSYNINYNAVNRHLWDSGISGSTAKYQFNGSARFAGQVDFDSNVNVGGITTTAGATIGGNAIVGGNLTTSGSLSVRSGADANIGLILQGASVWQGAVRFTADGTSGKTWTAGVYNNGADWQLNSEGVGNAIVVNKTTLATTLGGALTGSSATFTGSSGVLTNYLHLNNSDPSSALQEHHIYTRGNASGAYYGWFTQGNGAGAVTDLALRYAGADVLRFVGDTGTYTGRVVTSASTTTRAGLNAPHGTAPSAPVNGDLWTTTTGLFARINGTTQQYAPLASPTFTGTVNSAAITSTGIITGRSHALTAQTNTPTGTTYTWTLTSGNQLDITLTSSTGDVTITTASPTAGAYSFLSTTGHGTLARNLIVTQSGVTFIMTGKTSGNTITLDSIPATKRALYCFYWITTTKCFIDRVTLEA